MNEQPGGEETYRACEEKKKIIMLVEVSLVFGD